MGDVLNLQHLTGYAEYYTPQIILAARAVLGEIDLDPASCELANKVVRARHFYDKHQDGKTRHWIGRVFCNPPYDSLNIRAFTEQFIREGRAGRMTAGILLCNAQADARWYHHLLSGADALCLHLGRIKFMKDGIQLTQGSMHGQALFYLGNDTGLFMSTFRRLGTCFALRNSLVKAEQIEQEEKQMALI